MLKGLWSIFAHGRKVSENWLGYADEGSVNYWYCDPTDQRQNLWNALK